MASISHAITIDSPRSAVYTALTTTTGLKGWYSSAVEGNAGKGGDFTLTFAKHEGPFRWKVTSAEPDSLVQWECTAGPGQAAGTAVTFRLKEKGGRTTVEFDHQGFDESDEKLKVCNTLWGALAMHLKKYVEEEESTPAL